MNAVMASLMFTFGIGIHVVLWASVIEWVKNAEASAPIRWEIVILGFLVMMIGSFLILTPIAIVVRAVLAATGVV